VIEGIHWLGHAGFRIEGEKVIYIDPWKIRGGPQADIVLITHDHYDHCSPQDVARVSKPGTVVVTISSAAAKFKGNVRIVKPGSSLEVEGVHIEAVPAYNIGKPFHPRRAGHVGFIVEMGGRRIYHAGDTDLIPEMSEVKADVALLPVGGTYTMDAAQAAQAAERISPQVAIPMHYGDIVGSRRDAEEFKKRYKGQTVILEPER